MLGWHAKKPVMANGKLVLGDAHSFLEKSFEWLNNNKN